jgi:cytochrome c peroxidase
MNENWVGLRNIALTVLYMHDGRVATLEEVIDHYNSDFERNETLDPNLAKHPAGLNLSEAARKRSSLFSKHSPIQR